MTSLEVYERLTPKGKRRAVIIGAVSTVILTAALYAGGYLLCAMAVGLQVLAGVAG